MVITTYKSAIGLTLVELLVVVSIMIVLLALLAPALDRAIYQAELTVCAGKLKAVASGVTTYALANGRRYPDRDLPPNATGGRDTPFITPNLLESFVAEYDMRPGIQEVLDIDRVLQCPLTDQLPLAELSGEFVAASYTMWWGWFYSTPATGRLPGKFRLADRFQWADTRYSVLVGDLDHYAAGDGYTASHPDESGILALATYRRELVVTVGIPVPISASAWSVREVSTRGLLESNYAFDDGSVQRVRAVEPYVNADKMGEGMGAVPSQWSNAQPAKRHQIPRQ
jgi:hypothetical protein